MVMKTTRRRGTRGARISGVAEAKAHLSRMLRDVARGHEWIITERGEPIARLSPLSAQERPLEERLQLLERQGILEPQTENRPLPPPLPLEAGLAQRLLQGDRDGSFDR